MKKLTLILTGFFSFIISGCTLLPIKAQIKEEHFRFENFKRDKGRQLEYVHLMCFKNKPITWTQPKQYTVGEHELWVKARVLRRDIPNNKREAFAHFKVNFEAGKSYMLNRKIDEDNISIWIQEVDTGIGVSDVVVAELKTPLIEEYNLRKQQCESGTI